MSPARRETDPRRRLILALDLPTADGALRLADQLRPELTWVKVGLQLFGTSGPDVVRKLVSNQVIRCSVLEFGYTFD